jgi:hypothetical protein
MQRPQRNQGMPDRFFMLAHLQHQSGPELRSTVSC